MPCYAICRQSSYLFGRDRKVADIPTDHPSCSKQHCVLQYRWGPGCVCVSEQLWADGSGGSALEQDGLRWHRLTCFVRCYHATRSRQCHAAYPFSHPPILRHAGLWSARVRMA